MIGAVLLALAAASASAVAPTAPPRVSVTGGVIQGKGTADRLLFRGIPFAAPPLATRRWQAPAPVALWSGVRPAMETAAPCLQNDYGWNHGDHVLASEDCLTLDVGTPLLTGKKPVLVWIHGGSNRAGSPGDMIESSIVSRGIVVVGVRYRLGIFGFLSHRGFGAASGNYGLMDQVAALRWVRDNIARFGGDPARITIAGESAGAQDVGLLQAAPAARELFDQAIMESGTPGFGIAWRSLGDAQRIGDQLDALLGGVDPRRASAAALLAADLKLHDAWLTSDDYLWLRTTLDGAVLTSDPASLLRAAPARPLLIGSNAFELDLPGGRAWRDAFLARSYGRAEDQARRYYGIEGGRDSAPEPRTGTVDQRIATDATFACPAYRFAGLAATKGAPVWRYLFDGSPGGFMTAHGRELGYVFGDARLGTLHLQDLWVRFISTGNPGGGWPGFPDYVRLDPDGVSPRTDRAPLVCILAETL